MVEIEKSNIPGQRVETLKNTGTTNIPSKSNPISEDLFGLYDEKNFSVLLVILTKRLYHV